MVNTPDSCAQETHSLTSGALNRASLSSCCFLGKCWSAFCFFQLRECELSPGVNRDLTRRVRNINGITQHKQIVRNDIKLAAKLIHTLDDRTQLWASEPGTPPLPTVSDSP